MRKGYGNAVNDNTCAFDSTCPRVEAEIFSFKDNRVPSLLFYANWLISTLALIYQLVPAVYTHNTRTLMQNFKMLLVLLAMIISCHNTLVECNAKTRQHLLFAYSQCWQGKNNFLEHFCYS